MTQYFWQGGRIRLRPMQRGDEKLWLSEETSDSEATRLLGYGIELPKSEDAAAAFLEEHAEFNNKAKRIMFSIEALDGELVGGINIHSMNRKNGTFETGTRVYRAFRGRGVRLRCQDRSSSIRVSRTAVPEVQHPVSRHEHSHGEPSEAPRLSRRGTYSAADLHRWRLPRRADLWAHA